MSDAPLARQATWVSVCLRAAARPLPPAHAGVVISGDHLAAAAALAAGAPAFIAKPCGLDNVVDTIQRLLG